MKRIEVVSKGSVDEAVNDLLKKAEHDAQIIRKSPLVIRRTK